jgi:hypothetical protein
MAIQLVKPPSANGGKSLGRNASDYLYKQDLQECHKDGAGLAKQLRIPE